MSEFSSDREFYGGFLPIKDVLNKLGWKEKKPTIDRRKISAIFEKNGYSIYMLYGCKEDVENELL